MTTRRPFIAGAAGFASSWALAPLAHAQSSKSLRFGVGPLQPTAEDTKKSFGPFVAWLAKQLGVDYELSATTDWARMAVAMGSSQLDLAWMGP
ncbi:ABC-type phosphate/phosphonate transport system substrate-binding protein [Paraburkholderia atlantica]|uniref:Phosphonate transport system substrate-binding protein n=1 Tax=Paraburkholderia atlantica TaxID=2654982 RepID=A0A7W8VA71_PARAM|nr:phosphonate transport system substrate-binding protein [Paraburkholderia atlantica]